MRVTCPDCGKYYDDAYCWTICPHGSLEFHISAYKKPEPKKASLEKWEGHQLIRLEKEIIGPIPPGVQVGVSVAVLALRGAAPGRIWAYGGLRNEYPVWEFPGGKVEAGEDSRQAAVREIKEEMGLDVEIDQHVASLLVVRMDKSYIMQFYTAVMLDEHQTVKLDQNALRCVEFVDLQKNLTDKDIWWPATKFLWEDIRKAALGEKP